MAAQTAQQTADYSMGELMVAAAAREIRDGEVVFVGMRLPLIAFALAKRRHAPHATGLFENGLVRDTPSQELLYTMSDTPNIIGANMATRLINLMALLGQGAVDVGFIGGAEVDQYGNVNSSYIGRPPDRIKVKLPGSGGGADIASLSRRLLVIMNHEPHRLRRAVDYITSPGFLRGARTREESGLPRGGPSALITTRAVFGFDPERRTAVLRSYHPGFTPDEVQAATGWAVAVAPDCHQTPAPTAEELSIIREYDPQGFWTGRS